MAVSKMYYFPLTPRLQRLYASKTTTAEMRWHATSIDDEVGRKEAYFGISPTGKTCKTKDTTKSKEELNQYCARPEFKRNETTRMFPKASYTLDNREKKVLCEWVKSLKFPDRFSDHILIILCNLERIFPPSFFDSMEHLTVHLADEASLAGPVQYRWVYPFERLFEDEMLSANPRLSDSDLGDMVDTQFVEWFRRFVGNQGPSDMNKYIRDVAKGPLVKVKTYHGYVVNGYRLSKFEPFVVANQANQVYYCSYPSMNQSRKDWREVCKVKARSRVEVPNPATSSTVIEQPPMNCI
ncbi:hypothetical protein SASPL_133647 [Salvia splendens]|uniref:DUF4218 domain-containing protein n=1 Tax=Salvia splendens TaxID=180675 RepID=A0A8X8X610_SALSN|nr:hypothetical protein SASPL_133647 [Salvia splendens]